MGARVTWDACVRLAGYPSSLPAGVTQALPLTQSCRSLCTVACLTASAVSAKDETSAHELNVPSENASQRERIMERSRC